ncbi:hypothetical protein [Paraburkholderia rhynchosiae]|uniref:hypothetical protein n=1 Tax=Paraburkholderia rhynchosiae TaxID=487049 RepID=UPI001FD58421|nr:hypothetical protein [Paraburkholderia rhynchosiae]
MAADDRLDALSLVMQRIEHREKALAGHAENTLNTVREQSIDYEARASGSSGGSIRNGSVRQRHCDEVSRLYMSAVTLPHRLDSQPTGASTAYADSALSVTAQRNACSRSGRDPQMRK